MIYIKFIKDALWEICDFWCKIMSCFLMNLNNLKIIFHN